MVAEFPNPATSASGLGAGGIIAMVMLMIVVMVIVFLAIYVYTAWAWMTIAKKTKTEPSWLAWIPVANMVLMSRIAEMHWWPILLFVPAIVFAVLYAVFPAIIAFLVLYLLSLIAFSLYTTIWTAKAFEKVGRPKWWAWVTFVASLISMPLVTIKTLDSVWFIVGIVISMIGTLVFLIFLGIAAWGKSRKHKD